MSSLVQHKRRWAIVASALLLCAITGCDNSQKIIVGQWRSAGDSSAMVWEFARDGSVLMGSTRGKYSFGDQKRIKIQTPFGTSVYQIEISESRMTLTDPRGSKLEFTKSR
jgi:outer membrane biogenesis lipoprotein LolB